MSESFSSKRVSSLVNAAAKAAVDTILARLQEMNLQEKTTQGALHKLIGKVRTEPVTKTETRPVLDASGAPTLDDKGEAVTESFTVETGETKEVCDNWDLIKVIIAAVEETNPGAFVVEASGRNAGLYRGSMPAPKVKADATPEEKAAARQARAAEKGLQTQADAMASALAALRSAGVNIPEGFTFPTPAPKK